MRCGAEASGRRRSEYSCPTSGAHQAIPDPDGDELAGDKEARAHAKMIARDMLECRHWYKRGLEHWAFEITSGNGRLVGVVPFSGQITTRRKLN
jgi:hypothetical protein